MFCERCGARIEAGEKFCPNCGAKVTSYAPAAPRGARSGGARGGAGMTPARSNYGRGIAAKDPGVFPYILAGLGVLMILSTFFPFIKIDAWGFSYSFNLFSLGSALREIGEGGAEATWLTIFVFVTAIAAIATGLLKNKIGVFVSAALSIFCAGVWLYVIGAIEEEAYGMLGNFIGFGLRMLIFCMIAHAGLAIFTGIKKL